MPRWILRPAVVLGCLAVTYAAAAATLSEQRRALSAVNTSMRTADRMAQAGRNDEALAAFVEAQETLAAAADGLDERLERTFDRAEQRLSELHTRLTTKGLSPPPLTKVQRNPPTPTPPTLGPQRDPGEQGNEQVSFVDHVVPILTRHCGNCHVSGSKGGVSLASYNVLVEAPTAGKLVEVGAGMESPLIDVIVSGQMPPNGNTVPPADVRTLLTWINQGAGFDGDDASKPLGQLTRIGEVTRPEIQSRSRQPDAPPIAQPTGSETISFAIDVTPLLVDGCAECHGANGPRAGFSVANFERMWAGGDSGPAIVPGKPQESLLVQKLHGAAPSGARMPLNRPAWSDERIAIVEKWISEGATFDGATSAEPLARVAAIARVERSSPDQLSATRAEAAERMWRLAIPDESASRATSERFLAIGNLPENVLGQIAASAEQQASRAAQLLKQPEQQLSKGRVTLFAFAKRIDYSEFGTMVERRSLPGDSRGHARFDMVEPYLAIVYDGEADTQLDFDLARHLGQLWVANQSHDRLPDWFTTGAGMAIAARLHARDPQVRGWREAVPTAIAAASEPDAFMTGKLPPQSANILAFGFVDALMQKPANFDRLIDAASESTSFEAACQQAFERSPKELAELWMASARRR